MAVIGFTVIFVAGWSFGYLAKSPDVRIAQTKSTFFRGDVPIGRA
jgi:hypothetical protein